MSDQTNEVAQNPTSGAEATKEVVLESKVVKLNQRNGCFPPPADQKVDPLQEAQDDAARYKDQLLRTAAELENTRKRFRKDCEDARREGREQTFKKLVPVFDTLERAIESGGKAKTVAAIMGGIMMVMSQFDEGLRKLGINRIATVGSQFDPRVHEAVQQIESDQPIGMVVQELQSGYSDGSYIVRAALVVVSKGK